MTEIVFTSRQNSLQQPDHHWQPAHRYGRSQQICAVPVQIDTFLPPTITLRIYVLASGGLDNPSHSLQVISQPARQSFTTTHTRYNFLPLWPPIYSSPCLMMEIAVAGHPPLSLSGINGGRVCNMYSEYTRCMSCNCAVCGRTASPTTPHLDFAACKFAVQSYSHLAPSSPLDSFVMRLLPSSSHVSRPAY